MPWPLGLACCADNWSHDRHADGPEADRLICRIHDRVMFAWWRTFPQSEAKFNREHLGAQTRGTVRREGLPP